MQNWRVWREYGQSRLDLMMHDGEAAGWCVQLPASKRTNPFPSPTIRSIRAALANLAWVFASCGVTGCSSLSGLALTRGSVARDRECLGWLRFLSGKQWHDRSRMHCVVTNGEVRRFRRKDCIRSGDGNLQPEGCDERHGLLQIGIYAVMRKNMANYEYRKAAAPN